MKVAYILHTTEMHGSTISFLNMLEGLVAKGVEPLIIVPCEPVNTLFNERIVALGLSNRIVPVRIEWSTLPKYSFTTIIGKLREFHQLLKAYKRRWKSFVDVYRVIEDFSPSIVHTNVSVIREGYWVSLLMKIPHVFHVREYMEHSWIIPSLNIHKRILQNSITIYITERLKSYYSPKNNPNAFVIYNGVLNRTQYGPSRREKFFFCASRVSSDKGIDETIRAFSIFLGRGYTNYKLIIAGQGSEEYVSTLKEMAYTYGCGDSVSFLGHITNVTEYMHRASALVVASPLEPFGRMTAEASFCGCITIGRNTGGTKEIIEKTGGLFFSSVSELADCMEEVAMMGESRYDEMSFRAWKIANDSFSIQNNVESIYSLYKSLL